MSGQLKRATNKEAEMKRCDEFCNLTGGQCVGEYAHEGNHWHYTELGHYAFWNYVVKSKCVWCEVENSHCVPPSNPSWEMPLTRKDYTGSCFPLKKKEGILVRPIKKLRQYFTP